MSSALRKRPGVDGNRDERRESMQARDVMTSPVVTVKPETPLCEVASLLLTHAISAVPVVDSSGAPIGMVSESDLFNHNEHAHEARREWWLTLLAEGSELSPEFLASLRAPERTAREVMSAPVVSVEEDTDIREIAQLLVDYRIRSVPVVRDGRLVGIVSRPDLLRAFAAKQPAAGGSKPAGAAHDLFLWIDQHFHPEHHAGHAPPAGAAPAVAEGVGAEDFRRLVADFHHKEAEHQDAARRAAPPARAGVDRSACFRRELAGAAAPGPPGRRARRKGVPAAALSARAAERRRPRGQRPDAGLAANPARRGGRDLPALGARAKAARVRHRRAS